MFFPSVFEEELAAAYATQELWKRLGLPTQGQLSGIDDNLLTS